jgi:hypothetical protein
MSFSSAYLASSHGSTRSMMGGNHDSSGNIAIGSTSNRAKPQRETVNSHAAPASRALQNGQKKEGSDHE